MSDNDDLPNKCNSCALRYPCPPEFDTSLNDIEVLYKKGIINKRFPKSITYDCKTGKVTGDFCLLARPEWPNKEVSCASWQLDFGISKSDAIAIDLGIKMKSLTVIARDLAIIAAILAGLALLEPAVSLAKYIYRLVAG